MGAPSAEVRGQLQQAAQIVEAAKGRQLGLGKGLARASVASRSEETTFLLAAAAVSIPAFCCSFAAFVPALEAPEIRWSLLLLNVLTLGTSFPATVAALFPLRRYLKRRRAQLELLSAASPPAAPGESLRCRRCGAELHENVEGGLVDCSYCLAQNLVEPALVSRAAEQTKRLAHGLLAEVQSALADFSTEARRLQRMAVALGVAVPLFCLMAGTALLVPVVSARVELAPLHYALVETPVGTCLGEVVPAKGGEFLDFGVLNPFGDSRKYPRLAEFPGAKRVPATWLVGREVVYEETRWKVREVEGRRLNGNWAILDAVNPAEASVLDTSTRVEELCLTPEAR